MARGCGRVLRTIMSEKFFVGLDVLDDLERHVGSREVELDVVAAVVLSKGN